MWERLVCYHGTHLLVKNGETGVVPHYGMARSMLGRCRRGRCRWACCSSAPCGSVAGGVMKSCSFSSFCERAKRDGSRAPGVSVQCCYSNNCNAKSLGSRVSTSSSYFSLLLLCLCWHPLLKLTWGGRTRSWSNKSAFLEKGDCTF